MDNRFECLIDDNYRRLSGRLPIQKNNITPDTENRFSCLIEDSPRYRNSVDIKKLVDEPDNRFSKVYLDSIDNRKRNEPRIEQHKITRKPPDKYIVKESVNQRIKRLKESGELQMVPRLRSNTTQSAPVIRSKSIDEEFPSLNKIISNSAPSSPQMPEMSDRLFIKELPLPAPKYVALSIKNGKYTEQNVYSIEDTEYVPEPQVLVIKKPVYNKWADLLKKRAESRVYVNSLRDVYDRDEVANEEKFEN